MGIKKTNTQAGGPARSRRSAIKWPLSLTAGLVIGVYAAGQVYEHGSGLAASLVIFGFLFGLIQFGTWSSSRPGDWHLPRGGGRRRPAAHAQS